MTDSGVLIRDLLEFHRAMTPPLRVKRGQRPVEDRAQEKHHLTYEADPELYALAAVAPGAERAQQARALLAVLARERSHLTPEARRLLDRAAVTLMAELGADEVLTVFLALRQARVNRRAVRRAILDYLLNTPCLDDLCRRRRPAVRDVLEHALGRDTVRGFLKGSAPMRVPRGVKHRDRISRILPYLYGKGALPAMANAGYPTWHLGPARVVDGSFEPPKTVTSTNRGDIAATLVHLYRGGPSEALYEALQEYTDRAAQKVPRYPGRIGVVLDRSASTRGYGEREYALLSQAVALVEVLRRRVRYLSVHLVGGAGDPAMPAGSTDLAGALLEALGEKLDLVVVISDGYENRMEGDFDFVLSGARSAGVTTPVVYCPVMFTWKDDLEYRQLSRDLPGIPFWHENEFPRLLYTLFVEAASARGRATLRDLMMTRLVQLEREIVGTCSPN